MKTLITVIAIISAGIVSFNIGYGSGKQDGIETANHITKAMEKTPNFSKIFETPRFEWK